jgi:hypothetical protein
VGGLTSTYSLSLSLHTGNSASLTTAGGLKLTPPGVSQGILFGGLNKQLGGSTPQPPGNSNTESAHHRARGHRAMGSLELLPRAPTNVDPLQANIWILITAAVAISGGFILALGNNSSHASHQEVIWEYNIWCRFFFRFNLQRSAECSCMDTCMGEDEIGVLLLFVTFRLRHHGHDTSVSNPQSTHSFKIWLNLPDRMAFNMTSREFGGDAWKFACGGFSWWRKIFPNLFLGNGAS